MGKPTLTVSTYLSLSHIGLIEIADGIRTDSMRIEAIAAEVPWCVPCGIMVLPQIGGATTSLRARMLVARALACR